MNRADLGDESQGKGFLSQDQPMQMPAGGREGSISRELKDLWVWSRISQGEEGLQ